MNYDKDSIGKNNWISKRHRGECRDLAKQGDSGAADRLASCITGRLVARHGTRRIGRFSDVARKILKLITPA